MHRLLPLVLLALAPAFLFPERGAAGVPLAPDRPLASLVPEECLVYFEARGLAPLLEQGLAHEGVGGLLASGLGRALLAGLPLAPEEALARGEEWLGAPPLALLAEVAGAGVALGFEPASRTALLLARGDDADEVERALAAALRGAGARLGLGDALVRPHERRGDADVWRLGDARVARRGSLVVVSGAAHLVDEALELAGDPEGRGLLARAEFATQHDARPRGPGMWAWLDMAGIEPTADEGFVNLRRAYRNPGVQGLLGAEAAALLSAPFLTAGLELDGERLHLELAASGAPCRASLAPCAEGVETPAACSGDGLAEALLYRDWARFFTERADLFPPEALPGFAEALTNGALFFEGRDLGEDVLPRLSPWIRLYVRTPRHSEGRVPEIPLPAAGLVLVLDEPTSGEAWVSAFQTILAIVNVDQAQKGGHGLSMRLDVQDGVQITAGRYATPGPGDGVDVRYNLEPALAVSGRHLVMGTHVSVVKELLHGLAGAEPAAATGVRESLTLTGGEARRALAANRDVLVAQRMVQRGLGREEAARVPDRWLDALGAVERLRLELTCETPGAPRLSIDLALELAAEGAR